MTFEIGQKVRLVPTQGRYQAEIPGVVTAVTRTQVGVKTGQRLDEVRFRIADGMPVKTDEREFPCYKVVA